MVWQSLNRLLLLALVLRQTSSVLDCRLAHNRIQLSSSILSSQCTILENLCLLSQVTESLVGTQTTFHCTLSGAITFIKQNGSNTSGTQITNGGRISISGQTLTITNIQPEDEGKYGCSNGIRSIELVCLTVSGLARFKICDSTIITEYTNVPTVDNSCSQKLNATVGMSVTFDTRLLFGEQGDCQCIEEVTVLRVRKFTADDPNQIVFFCDERRSCHSKEGFVVRRGSEQPYDFSLVLQSVNMSSNGMYFVEVEVRQPGLSSVRKFWKIFQLTVSPECLNSCSPLKRICSNGATVKEGVTGGNVQLTCASGTITQRQRPGGELVTINADNPRYHIDGSSMMITDLQSNDEGLYHCSSGEEICLVVTILVEFLNCPQRRSDNECEETVYAEEGQPIIFDTRLMYNTSSSVCQCYQRIISYRFFAIRTEIVDYTCYDPRNCTSVLGSIAQSNNDNLPYYFSLQLHSPKPENGTKFVLQIVGLHPEGVYTLIKTFNLNFVSTTAMTTDPSTMPTTNGGFGRPQLLLSAAIGGSVAAVALSVAILLSVVSVLICSIYCPREHKNKNLERKYSEVNDNVYSI